MKKFLAFAFFIALIAIGVRGCSQGENASQSETATSTQRAATPTFREVGAHDAPSGKRNSPAKLEKKDEGEEKKISTSSGRKIEVPARMQKKPERIISREAYTLSFNRETNEPNWVAWCLQREETDGPVHRRDEFLPDPDVPAPHRVESYDYSGSGYDRGHMAPAADMKWSGDAMRDCFYMSNICPQTHELNAGAWAKLEGACRRWAQSYGRIYIVCGPIFYQGKHKSIGREHVVTVPDAFFKCIYAVSDGKPQAIAFVMRNTGAKQNMYASALTVDEVEAATGMDFFPNLPDRTERVVESQFSLKDWK